MDRKEWLKARQTGIGGSDVAAILGFSKWKSPLEIYLSKVEPIVDEEDNPSMEWGRRLEPVIRQAYADATGRKVTLPDEQFRSKEHPFMIANVDGICDDGRILEIKTARSESDWGTEGTDEIPEYYRTQVQHYMTVLGAKVCDVAVLIGASDFRIYTVNTDPELEQLLIEEESKFWHLVETRTPPKPRTLEDIAQTFPNSQPTSVEATEAVYDTIAELAEVRKEEKNLKAQEDALLLAIQGYMGANESLSYGGKVVATWKSSKPTARLDSAALKAKMPDVYNQFLKASAGSRRFLLKALGA